MVLDARLVEQSGLVGKRSRDTPNVLHRRDHSEPKAPCSRRTGSAQLEVSSDVFFNEHVRTDHTYTASSRDSIPGLIPCQQDNSGLLFQTQTTQVETLVKCMGSLS